MTADAYVASRRRILSYLATNPGVHVRRIGRALSLSTGLLSYHLAVLEERGLVRAESDGHRKRYFPAHAFTLEERRILGLLQERVPRRILRALDDHGLRTFDELRRSAGVTKSTLSYHLKKLRRSGVVLEGRARREKMYGLRNPGLVADLLAEESFRANGDGDGLDGGSPGPRRREEGP